MWDARVLAFLLCGGKLIEASSNIGSDQVMGTHNTPFKLMINCLFKLAQHLAEGDIEPGTNTKEL